MRPRHPPVDQLGFRRLGHGLGGASEEHTLRRTVRAGWPAGIDTFGVRRLREEGVGLLHQTLRQVRKRRRGSGPLQKQ